MVVEEAERLAAPGVALLDGPADLCDGGHRRHRRLHVVPHLVQGQVAALLLLSLELSEVGKLAYSLPFNLRPGLRDSHARLNNRI